MAKTGKTILWQALVIGLLSLGLTAQAAVRVEGLIEGSEVGLGQPFNFTVSVISEEAVDPSEPDAPALDGLRITNQSTSSSTSSRMMMGSGGWQIESTRQINYTYEMLPLKEGKITIPPFSVTVAGKTLKTKPIVLNSSQAAQQRPLAQGGPQGAFPDDIDPTDDPDEMFRQLLARRMGQAPAVNDLPSNPNEVLYLQTEVDKTQVYEGEQITVNWYLLVRGNLLSLDRTKFPDLKGFWKEIIEEVPALQFSQEVINGQVYRKALLASHALFPIKSGKSIIDQYKIKGQVQVPNMGMMGFGGKSYKFDRASERIEVNVLPLPKEGQPKDFAGAVGNFNVQVILDNNVVTQNQPMTLKIRFEGAGNAKLIDLPQIPWPASLENYDVKSESKFFKNGQSYKQFEVMLVPHEAGDLTIPPISVSLFDPVKKEYYTKTMDAIQLKVLPGTTGAPINSQRVSEKKPEAPQGPVLPPPVMTAEASMFSAPVKASGIGLLYLLVFAILGVRLWQEFGQGPQRRDLEKWVNVRMKKADELSKQGQAREASVVIVNLFGDVIGEISGQEGGSYLQLSKMLKLCPPSFRHEFGEEVEKNVEIFQTLSFAPEAAIAAMKEKSNMTQLLTTAKSLLMKMAKQQMSRSVQ